MTLSSDGKELMNKRITGYKKTGTNWAATEKSYLEVLGFAPDSFLDQLVKEVNRIDDNYEAAMQRPDGNGLDQKPVQPVAVQKSTPIKSGDGMSIVGPLDVARQCPQRSGEVVVLSGKRTASGVKSRLTGIAPSLQALYRDRFELDSGLDGKVCVMFTIASSGKVGNAEIMYTSLNDPPIETALIDTLSRVRFGKFVKPTENSDVFYSVEFKSETAKSSKAAAAGVIPGILAVVPLIILLVTMPRY